MEEPSNMQLSPQDNRYPYCIVWTPIPLLTWIIPFIGHIGICTSAGIIRDFGGSYYVGKDRMAFGNPTKYWQLDPNKTTFSWDQAVNSAAEVYQTRIHNICCDNCHSMVALALNKMQYQGIESWNMVKLCFLMLIHGKYLGVGAFLKSNLPFVVFFCLIVILGVYSN